MTPVIETEQRSSDSLSAYGIARCTIEGSPLNPSELERTHAYWRACNYLALGMIYLQDNPLLKEPLKPEHIKNRLLGHWGSSPGLAFTYVHLNRLIKKFDLNMIFMAGPGHGAPGVLAPSYLEGGYSDVYPEKSEDERGLREFFKQFSFPGGIGSHCTPETPGSIHEGGELGYVLSHACGAAFDNPDHVAISIHNYRWRLGLAEGEARFDALEKRLAEFPVITVPTITMEGDANGAPHLEPSAYANKFTGKYEHRLIKGGIGHNLPQEAPQAFAEAVVDVAAS